MSQNKMRHFELMTPPTAALIRICIVEGRKNLDTAFREKCDEVVRTGNWWSTPGLLAREVGAYASFLAVVLLMPFGETKALKWSMGRVVRFATA